MSKLTCKQVRLNDEGRKDLEVVWKNLLEYSPDASISDAIRAALRHMAEHIQGDHEKRKEQPHA